MPLPLPMPITMPMPLPLSKIDCKQLTFAANTLAT
jgi:hypothetical protein